MAKVKFYKILNSALSSLPKVEGQFIFVQDTGYLYIDKDNINRVQIRGPLEEGAGISIGSDGVTITNSGVRSIATGSSNGTISVNTNGTTANVAVKGLGSLAYANNISTSKITSGTLPVERGGTGAATLSSGQVLIGNGTSAVTTKAIDTTTGGTASSASLITSGAVKAGLDLKLNTSLKGAASGLAELDAEGKVPSSQLPSFVDDVLEYDSLSNFPTTGETGKIYVAKDTNKTYRWGGSAYVVISETLALGETSSTAYRGDRGKIAYDHSQSTHARTDATKTESSSTNGNIKINGTETTVYTHPNSGATAGTYRSVTVNAAGHVTAGTNPTTLSGYGITDAKIASGVITLGSNTITPLTASSTLDATKLSGTIPTSCYTDTKNTAGSIDSSSKLFLIGATSQAANPQTYSQDTAYVDTNGHLYSNSKQVVNLSDTQALTNKTYNGYTLAAACAKAVVTSVDTSASLPTSGAVKTFVEGKGYVTTDTKNTAGSTDTSSKIFLIGATSQAANPQTYSDNEIYATSGVLTTKSVQVGGTAATMQYNSTDKCIEFVFA